MSLSLLLEKYDVSTEEGLEKALNEIEKEEEEVEEALSNVLSRACAIEGRLRTTSLAYARLADVRSDAQAAGDMVQRTADLARDSRVAECQQRVHDLIDLQLCSAGVEAAIRGHDYETGAAHVARFLAMDPGSVAAARARGAADPREAMNRAAQTLRDNLVKKFEEAAKKDDEASVERLFKLFPQIGRADEGVDLLARYLAKHVESSIRRNCTIANPSAEGAVFADALTRLLEAGGAVVERARTLAAGAAPARLSRALAIIQPVICGNARRLSSEMRTTRGLSAASADPRRAQYPPEPRTLEPTLDELALMHSRIYLYFAFLRRKAETDASSLEEPAKTKAVVTVHKIIAESDLMRTAQDLLGHYLTLERYFLEESVSKALKMATPQPGVTCSSLVDDVYFIARKCIRRGLSTGSVDGACAVLNEAATQLEREVAAALRRWVRSAPSDPLPLPLPPGTPANAPLDLPALPAATATLLGQRLNRDVEAQKALFLAHMSEADAGAEWAERLAAEACADAEPLFRASPAASAEGERAKFQSCAAGLAAAATAFRTAHDLALAGLCAALKPRAAAWADAIASPTVEDENEAGDALPAALDELAASAHAELPSRAADALLVSVVADITTRAEGRLLLHVYDREGGLAVERRTRRLAAWAGGGAGGARERCARLTQAASLLALERLAHVPDALRPTPRLAVHEVKDILARSGESEDGIGIEIGPRTGIDEIEDEKRVQYQDGDIPVLDINDIPLLIGTHHETPPMSVRVAQNWFKRFQSGDFDVKDEPRSGRPVTEKVNAILENVGQDRHISFYDIAEELRINHKNFSTLFKKDFATTERSAYARTVITRLIITQFEECAAFKMTWHLNTAVWETILGPCGKRDKFSNVKFP
ncbi:Conserved oligomeric Golgi complex subunit 4 [Eumeta japonica]|uniref:Conserved oligomeric Golgi complex subunit 4 n=1 Tax=Eumeta variegata TaxID=151549 RepID=A0A4C1WSU3_EUMVA|nr:Conserved oligomeric Golgi complex subunit 4 [Eumeta japonica]